MCKSVFLCLSVRARKTGAGAKITILKLLLVKQPHLFNNIFVSRLNMSVAPHGKISSTDSEHNGKKKKKKEQNL